MSEISEICTFYGIKRVVMRKTNARVKELGVKGKGISTEDFSKICKEEWKKAKKERVKVCANI